MLVEDEFVVKKIGKVTKVVRLPSIVEYYLSTDRGSFASYESRSMGEVHDWPLWNI